MKYIVTYGSGSGPDVWVAEAKIEAETIRGALDEMERRIAGEGMTVVAIEQDD